MDYIIAIYLSVLSILDIKRRAIPLDTVLIPIAAVAISTVLQGEIKSIMTGSIPGVMLCLIALALPRCLGLGDGLLTVSYGIYYGWKDTCIWIMLGFLLTAVYGLCVSGSKKYHREIPFIPFLTLVHIGGLLC